MYSENPPIFTIFLPVRNGGTHLPLCVESILAQTYPNFQLVILENQSADGTAEWLHSLEQSESKVRVIPSDTVLSMEDNWQRTLAVPKQEFMTIIGHDDLLDPFFLEEMVRIIHEEPDASLYHTHFRLIDAKGRQIRACNPIPRHESAAEFIAARMTRIRDSFGTGYVMRSRHYEEVGGIPAYPLLMYADDSLWANLIGKSYKATSSRICFSYRFHSDSISGSPSQSALFSGLKEHLILLRELAVEDSDIARALRAYAPSYVSRGCRNYYYYLVKEAPLGKGVAPDKLRDINEVMREFADTSIDDTSPSKIQMIIWHWLVDLGRRFLPLIENALNKQ